MLITSLFTLLGGIGLFLFGMSVMGDGLKKASGSKLAPILYKMSNTRLKGVLLGTGVTAVIQSSSATSVMVVGFVNSRMMKLRSGIHVILGSILGTSVTGWVICLSYIEGQGGLAELLSTSTITSIAAIAGTLMRMLSKKQMTKDIGSILLGFAVLMFGMSAMSGAMEGMRDNPAFLDMFTSFSHPVVGILIGILISALLQSASAAVGILQALSVTGAIDFSEALPMLMGISIGAALPVVLSSIGASTVGKRTAYVYLIITVMGVLGSAVLFYTGHAIWPFSGYYMEMNPFSTAMLNTLLRLVIVILLIPMDALIERMVCLLFPGKEEEDYDPGLNLEERFIATPAMAIEQSRITIMDMAGLCRKAFNKAVSLFENFQGDVFSRVVELEDAGDRYEDALGTYLVKITAQSITKEQNEAVSLYLHTLSDFERISDHALNLAENAKELHDKEITFSGEALRELKIILSAVSEVVDITMSAFAENDISRARQVEPLEEWIDDLCDVGKLGHVERLQRKECGIVQGFVFNDILNNLERISDHCSNIAVAMIELDEDVFATHEYLHDIRSKRGAEFERLYGEFQKKYSLKSTAMGSGKTGQEGAG